MGARARMKREAGRQRFRELRMVELERRAEEYGVQDRRMLAMRAQLYPNLPPAEVAQAQARHERRVAERAEAEAGEAA